MQGYTLGINHASPKLKAKAMETHYIFMWLLDKLKVSVAIVNNGAALLTAGNALLHIWTALRASPSIVPSQTLRDRWRKMRRSFCRLPSVVGRKLAG